LWPSKSVAIRESRHGSSRIDGEPKDVRAKPRSDVAEAAAFALRPCSGAGQGKEIALTSTIEPDIVVACDRQVGRRIIHQLIIVVLEMAATPVARSTSSCGV